MSAKELEWKRLTAPEVKMRETIELLLSLPEVEQSKMEMAKEYRFTRKSPAPACPPSHGSEKPVMVTINRGTVEAVAALCKCNMRPAILNFAHSYNCGGGFEHTGGSQEEDIFRKTSVFLSLWPHRRSDDGPGVLRRGMWIGSFDEALPRKKAFYPHTECGGVYSPHVRIVRDRGNLYSAKDIEHAPIFGVVTVAAQDCGRDPPFRMDLLSQKARTVLHIAADNGHDALVLGAFGCGYFSNPPDCVSAVFQNLLSEEFASAFRIVVFAIPDRAGNNLTAFTGLFPLQAPDALAKFVAKEQACKEGCSRVENDVGCSDDAKATNPLLEDENEQGSDGGSDGSGSREPKSLPKACPKNVPRGARWKKGKLRQMSSSIKECWDKHGK
eukprot:gnl/MRDRNA2_/MRDRNA2_87577_c0_seq1.p1 gnl/MRDRNA2_/MRDRNA2_87577_c0~~gnl/MRDRNA2_/MRDRNA2_87577_c0_seq1.p1  ORF type:complete len:407 (-),score=67.68 gnl/MRDRNA2_/MRDRNA2_87577_c0_seq1:124-1275(-)